MRTRMLAGTSVLLLTALAAPLAFGQEISDALRVTRQGLSFNAHALGMGNAYSTIGYDVSALRFNPATMGVNKKSGSAMAAAKPDRRRRL